MWLMTTNGMISCVEHRDDPNIVIARARSKKHLENTFPNLKSSIFYMDDADYNWRLYITKKELKEAINKYVDEELTYDNFKKECEKRNPNDSAFLKSLHGIWYTMFYNYKGEEIYDIYELGRIKRE